MALMGESGALTVWFEYRTAAAFTIPGRTPFTLTATGSDADNDPLTYVWEEFDLGAANAEGVLDPTVTTGPLFRGFDPMPSASRSFG